MTTKNKKNEINQAFKAFFIFNKLETGEENKDFAKRAGVSQPVIYNLISGRTKKATRFIAKAIVDASKNRCSREITMKDLGYDD